MSKRREQATNSSLPENIRVHDDADRKRTRLEHSAGALERLRSQELITRYVPPLPAVVVDVGGGTGPYAIWLAEQG